MANQAIRKTFRRSEIPLFEFGVNRNDLFDRVLGPIEETDEIHHQPSVTGKVMNSQSLTSPYTSSTCPQR